MGADLATAPTSGLRVQLCGDAHADQNERDYAALQAAVKDGRAQATSDI